MSSLEEIHKHLDQAQDAIVNFMSKKKKLTEENPVGSGMEGSEIPTGDKVDLDVPSEPGLPEDPIADLANIIGELGNLGSEELMQRLRGIPEDEIQRIMEILKQGVDHEDEEF